MPSPKATVVNIMGIDYPIKGDYEPAYIQKIAADLDARMRDVSSQLLSKSLEKTAVITALNLDDELFTLEGEKDSLILEIEKKVKAIIEKIDRSIIE
jgi:cell division protein ZapA